MGYGNEYILDFANQYTIQPTLNHLMKWMYLTDSPPQARHGTGGLFLRGVQLVKI